MSRRARRPPLAALLSILQPGLGQLYLREWGRAAAWVGLWIAALAVAVHTVPLDVGVREGAAAFFGFFGVIDVPISVVLAMLSVAAFSAIDAYRLARRTGPEEDSNSPQCPHCGRELDPTLEFCHWCTAELE